jgi:hypothetical protein
MTRKITSILLFSVFIAISASVNGQGKIYSNDKYPAIEGQDKVMPRLKSNLFKKESFSGWFVPTNAINDMVTFKTYVNFLTTDSTVRYIGADGASSFNNWHLSGVCFDPKDENYGNAGDFVYLSEYNPYKVDSVLFRYLYVRKLDSAMVGGIKTKVVDTLIFQFHNPGNMRYSTFGSSPTELYGVPSNFVRSAGGASVAAYTEKVPLTELDSTTVNPQGWRSKYMQIAIPASLAMASAGKDKNQVGFNVFFKQMVPNNFGDTMEASNGATITNPVNYAGFSLFVNEGAQVDQEKYRSNSYFTVSKQLYGGNLNGWTNYIPGNAYFSARYMFAAFKVSTPNLKAEDINKKGYGISKVIPNPAHTGEDVHVEFSLGNSEEVTLTVSDLLGKTLKSIKTDKLNAGFNIVTFNTANLKAGIYFYTISAGNFKSSKKFTVID